MLFPRPSFRNTGMSWPAKRTCLLCLVSKTKKTCLWLWGKSVSETRLSCPGTMPGDKKKIFFFQVRISPYSRPVAFFSTSFRISCHLRLSFVRVCRHIHNNVLCCVHLWALTRCEACWLRMQTATLTHREAFPTNINVLSQPVHGWHCTQCPGKNDQQKITAVFEGFWHWALEEDQAGCSWAPHIQPQLLILNSLPSCTEVDITSSVVLTTFAAWS